MVFIFASMSLICFAAEGEELTGHPRVVDGDTLAFGDAKVRMNGIDAPEKKQICQDRGGQAYRCGESARAVLNGQVGSVEVRCEGAQYDRYQRLIATCWKGTVDLNAWMVEQGWAVAFRRYSEVYVHQEDRARAGRAGMWAGDFEMPWDWRRNH
jgi:endonuclease YncB( thermonuclease family)